MPRKSKSSDVDILQQFLSRALRAQAAVTEITARASCPFCGCRDQKLIPCEVQVEQDDGSHKAESWFAVLCACMTNTAASGTEAGAWKIWNARA